MTGGSAAEGRDEVLALRRWPMHEDYWVREEALVEAKASAAFWRAEADRLREALDDLLEWTVDLRAKTRDAASFWDEFVGPSEKGHPSDEVFAEFRDEMDVDGAIEDARTALASVPAREEPSEGDHDPIRQRLDYAIKHRDWAAVADVWVRLDTASSTPEQVAEACARVCESRRDSHETSYAMIEADKCAMAIRSGWRRELAWGVQ